jgi:WS/DGAT/MGAT family acyltransferase
MRQMRGRAAAAGTPVVIERVSGEDLMQLASDVGPVPWQVGAILRMDTGPDFDVAAAVAVLAERVSTIPRLRQVLVRTPLGCGRPVWVDDADFDIGNHLRSVGCDPPGDESALLDRATAIVTDRLPSHRPLWRATFVTGLPDSRVALVIVFHHVLADGIGGLAMLANLVDGASGPVDGAQAPVEGATAPAAAFPRAAASRGQLAADAFHSRVAALARLPAVGRRFRQAIAELNPAGTAHAPATTLNRPTGAQRRLAVTRAALSPLRDLGHAHDATVNDVVLTAVTGALGGLLARRGDPAESLVVSVPVSARTAPAGGELGNRTGVMTVSLPLHGDRIERLERIAAITRAHKTAARGASAALLGPLFRTLAALHMLRWIISRQRMVNIFETNMRGPSSPLAFAGNRITDVLPVTAITGNVTLSFAVISYAADLAVVIAADPERHPDLGTLSALLQQELGLLAAAGKATGKVVGIQPLPDSLS